jgi:hypothetical protein
MSPGREEIHIEIMEYALLMLHTRLLGLINVCWKRQTIFLKNGC